MDKIPLFILDFTMQNYQQILEEIQLELQPYLHKGTVANYIPALSKVNPNQFAMSITLFDGTTYSVGCSQSRFSIQSISKVFTFTKALNIYRHNLYKKVGREPSGNPFNSLVQLEYEKGIPRNPFINAGAIVVTDALLTHYQKTEKTFENILTFIQEVSDNQNIGYDPMVWRSECEHGFRNLALANLMKSFGNLENEASSTVETYFKHCAITMNTQELARSILFLANHGIDPINGKKFITSDQAKRINAVMLTCGHYDASGDFAFHVGLPAKSGVGGGIVAVVPKKMGIAVFSPRLNSWGNSLLGTKALELFTAKTGFSIF
ncbi:MAG: Glutaminase (EC [uncultured Sulfurovum sp.]|uniref:Glutaminase n=1 Tax=uncultured Sulfurovum sp. TaxID=269237 RepID=A0A6S6SQ45_9BACT|nr:MAG: Glutaminase (EC [uncultured Sulfurovum sp.]